MKVKSILDIPTPKNIKEVQSLTGRMTALERFLSHLVENDLPFYKALSKAKNFIWDEECQEAFSKLKEHLASPPVLIKPRQREPLYLYLAVVEKAIS